MEWFVFLVFTGMAVFGFSAVLLSTVERQRRQAMRKPRRKSRRRK